MRSVKMNSRMLFQVFSCFMCVVLALGISVPGALVAYAADGNDHDNSDNGLAAQGLAAATGSIVTLAGEQNYAVFDNTDNAGTLTFYYGTPTGVAGTDYYEGYDTATYTINNMPPWSSKSSNVKKAVFDSSVEGHLAPVSTAYWFYSCSSCTDVQGLGYLDTSNVKSMSHMFYNCSALTQLDLSGFTTSNVEDMSFMFGLCYGFTDCGTDALSKLRLGESFNTTNVTSMAGMFQACKNVTTFAFPSSFSTAKVTNMHLMYSGCEAMTDPGIAGFNTGKVKYFSQMFENCKSLTTLYVPFNTASAENKPSIDSNYDAFNCMFYGCSKLETVTLGDSFVVPNGVGFTRVFENCVKLQEMPDLSKCLTSNVSSLKGAFSGCTGLISADFSTLNLSNVESTESMFYNCTNLASVKFGDMNTGKLVYMASMFYGCTKLTSVEFASLTVKDRCQMRNFFYNCSSLETLDLSKWDTTQASVLTDMFSGCSKLKSVKLGENFSFSGKSGTISSSWALFPEHSTTAPNNGLWWKGAGTTTYTRYTMRSLPADERAGTWTWSEGIAVTTIVSPSASGSVSFSSVQGEGVNTGAEGDVVTMTATPAAGYEFVSWELTSGADTGTLASTSANPTTFTLGEKSGTVRASFVESAAPEYTIGALSPTEFTYNGGKQVPALEVTDKASGTALVKGADYTVSYERDGAEVKDPTGVGTYTVYVTGKGAYEAMGKQSAGSFDINPAKVTPSVKLAATSYTWNGKAKTPAVTVKVGKTTLQKGVDYTVAYASGRKDVGTYAVKVSARQGGNYTFAAKTLSFAISPKGTAIKAPTAASKALTVKWAKQATKMSSSRITGYQVQVATDKKFTKNLKKATAKGYDTTSKKIAKLKAKTAYYSRVRTYKTVGGKTYFSPWATYSKAVKTQ